LARLGWERFFFKCQRPHSVNTSICNINHPTAHYLHRLACAGVQANFLSYWTREQCDTAYHRGPHPSASNLYSQFILADMYDYAQMGYWVVLPYKTVRHYKHLCIAPAGVVPQRERCPRPIIYYSFYGTNQECVDHTQNTAMQFGAALQRLLQ
jgi:hypothetical protein